MRDNRHIEIGGSFSDSARVILKEYDADDKGLILVIELYNPFDYENNKHERSFPSLVIQGL